MNITFMHGDATNPQAPEHKVIVHVCNDLGKWGKGFVLSLSKRWPEAERVYRSSFYSGNPPRLGEVQFVTVNDEITVANVIGQHGVKTRRNSSAQPIRYGAVQEGLKKVASYAKAKEASVHMPRIGCGLAGGSWDAMEPIVNETLTAAGVPTTVYDFGNGRS